MNNLTPPTEDWFMQTFLGFVHDLQEDNRRLRSKCTALADAERDARFEIEKLMKDHLDTGSDDVGDDPEQGSIAEELKEAREALKEAREGITALEELLDQAKTQRDTANKASRVSNEKYSRKALDFDRVLGELHECRAQIEQKDTQIAELKENIDDQRHLEEELSKALDELEQKTKQLKTQTGKPAPAPHNEADVEGALRHIDAARRQFDEEPDKALRSINRARSLLDKTTTEEEEDE